MSNSESKTPEVGEIWKRKGSARRYVHITSIGEILLYVYFLESDLTKDYHNIEIFLENYEYIDKAKGSIDDLFKIKRTINKERMKDGKRWCTRCKTYKDLDCFYIDRRRKDGISGICRECNRTQAKAARLKRSTLGTFSVAKGVVKSIKKVVKGVIKSVKKAGEELDDI